MNIDSVNTALKIIITMALIVFVNEATANSKKVLYIDSYHQGYAWSDGIEKGIRETLASSNVDLKVFRMDTKRKSEESQIKAAATEAMKVINDYKPDVVIAADDNASKFIISPHYNNAELPFVFAGVNWDASDYGFPSSNVTGMIEVAPIPQLLEQLKTFAKGERVGFIGPDLLTSRKEAENYKTVFDLDVNTYFAKDFDDWKKGFLSLQESVDMLIIDTDSGVYASNKEEMIAFVEGNTKIPTGSSYDFMAPFAMVVFAKVANEQGEWAANTALQILNGKSPDSIDIARNEQGKLIVNAKISEKTGIELPFSLIEAAEAIIE